MTPIELVLRLLGGALLLAMNGFFVVTEFALTRVRQFPESEFDEEGLRRAWEMTEELEVYLSGCQVGITVASVSLGVVAEPAVAALFGGGRVVSHTVAVVLALVVINLLHVVAGEQIPTYLGVERTKTVARYGASGLYYWTKGMYPAIRLADWIAKSVLSAVGVEMTRSWTEGEGEGEEVTSRADLRREIGSALSSDVLPEERQDEVIGALEIGTEEIRDVGIGREDIVALSTENSLDENLDIVKEHPHVRFPLVRGGLEDVVGTVYTPVLLREIDALRSGEKTLEDVALDPMTVAADASVASVIDAFQARKQELALVVENGRVVGLVTPTDTFEEITGALPDPIEEPDEEALAAEIERGSEADEPGNGSGIEGETG